jgi:hypothetical protein
MISIKNGIFEQMSSSYFAEALAQDENSEVDYAKITLYRSTNKRFATVLNSNNIARKEALHQDVKSRLKDIYENHKILNELGIAASSVNLEPNGNSASMP